METSDINTEKHNSIYAHVVLDRKMPLELTYTVPHELLSQVKIGSYIQVPIRSQVSGAFVIKTEKSVPENLLTGSHADRPAGLKAILSVNPDLSLTQELVTLAQWTASYYGSPLGTMLRTMIPKAVRTHEPPKTIVLKANQKATDAIADRKRSGQPGEKTFRWTKKRRQIVALLNEEGPLSWEVVRVRTSASLVQIRELEAKSFITVTEEIRDVDPYGNVTFLPQEKPILTPEQNTAFQKLKTAVDQSHYQCYLLQGVTGSGKTEVYLRVIEHVLKRGGGAIVMVPEITLTPQMVERFKSRLAEKVAVLHSQLSELQRRDQWMKIYSGRAQVAVGPRSAIFAPIRNLQTIIVDEEHESTYKQEEEPRYNARDLAVARGSREELLIVLGAATPSLESRYNVGRGKYERICLTRRVAEKPLPKVTIIDMRREIREQKHATLFSRYLLTNLQETVSSGNQAILFLNRRGYSRSWQCVGCGHTPACPECSIPLAYHKSPNHLICHLCGATAAVPRACPKCRKSEHSLPGTGTERVVAMIGAIFPDIRVGRLDSDVTRSRYRGEEVLRKFRAGLFDVLVGTQLVTKGLDFPRVTLVGVLYADVALNLPDFRATEKTFQLITQVAGRAGRGDIPGEVIVQTFTPDAPAIQCARSHDVEKFYANEIQLRKTMGYPPVSRMIRLIITDRIEDRAVLAGKRLHKFIGPLATNKIRVLGPAPCFFPKIKNRFRYQLSVRGPTLQPLVKLLSKFLLKEFRRSSTRVVLDVDPMSML